MRRRVELRKISEKPLFAGVVTAALEITSDKASSLPAQLGNFEVRVAS